MRRGADVLFSTYLEGIDYVKKQGYPVVSSPPMSMTNDQDGKIDLKMSSVTKGVTALPRFLHQMNVEIEYIKSYNPDVVVADTRLSSVFAANLLGVPTILILNQFQPIVPRSRHNFRLSKIADGVLLTLIGRGWAASDIILIPDFPEPYTISIESLRIPKPYKKLVRRIGTILPVKPQDVVDIERIRKEAGVKEGQRFIFSAISGPKQERMPLIKTLKSIFEDFPEKYRIVMSMGLPNGDSFSKSFGNFTMVPWVRNRFEYLKSCDLVISRAGHGTVLQSICFGKPQILIPTPGHTEQYGNARRAKELGVAEAIHQSELTRDSLLGLIESVMEDAGYQKSLMEINSNGNLEDGIENAVQAIGEFIQK
jgi:uncharacterized protein (TIGR00661 family)